MEKVRVISLGAWCRPAFQIGRFAENNERIEGLKGPFDWTITSFNALRHCLDRSFKADEVLQADDIVSSYAKSGMCRRSGVIFHHALNSRIIGRLGDFPPGETISSSRKLNDVAEKARGRFLHTFGTLARLREFEGRTLFVRWRRFGHPDRNFPAAFEGENKRSLSGLLQDSLQHDRFHVLSVQSKVVKDRLKPFWRPISSFEADGSHISCSIIERKGWNGDQTASFKGDEHSWKVAFEMALSYLETQGSVMQQKIGG